MAKILISPAEGRRVRDPFTPTMQVIGAGYVIDGSAETATVDGKSVTSYEPTDPYWYRRFVAGDITIDGPVPATAPATAAPTPADPVQVDLANAEAALQAAETAASSKNKAGKSAATDASAS